MCWSMQPASQSPWPAVMFTANPSPSSNASYQVDWPIMSDRSGTICAQRGSDAKTSAAACAAEVTALAEGAGVVPGVPVGAGPGVPLGEGVAGTPLAPGPPLQAMATTARASVRPAVSELLAF